MERFIKIKEYKPILDFIEGKSKSVDLHYKKYIFVDFSKSSIYCLCLESSKIQYLGKRIDNEKTPIVMSFYCFYYFNNILKINKHYNILWYKDLYMMGQVFLEK